MSEVTDPKKVRNARIKLIALLSVFLVPFIGATVMHKLYRDGGELSVSSNGELVWPAVPVTAFALQDVRSNVSVNLDWMKERWTLLYLPREECGEVCSQNIYHMRQIHISLGKEAHRLQRLLVSDHPDSVKTSIGSDYPNLVLAGGDTQILFRQIDEAVGKMPGQQNSLFLIDPLGNIMMRFSPDLNPKGVLKDIKRALRASQIG